MVCIETRIFKALSNIGKNIHAFFRNPGIFNKALLVRKIMVFIEAPIFNKSLSKSLSSRDLSRD